MQDTTEEIEESWMLQQILSSSYLWESGTQDSGRVGTSMGVITPTGAAVPFDGRAPHLSETVGLS